jgi:2-phosphoglycerate kinase
MLNVCSQCGEHAVEKIIDPSGPFAICPFCHYAQPFLQQPLFIITGASGAGKTTVCDELVPLMRHQCVILETDILWGVTPVTSDTYHNMWLRVAKNIGQAGLPVVLCGTTLPEYLEECPERRYFSTVYYLAMVADDHLLAEHLKQRPEWRQSGSTEFVERMVQFNRWLKEHASTTNPPMTLYDSSDQSIAETADEVAGWIKKRLEKEI